LLKPDSVWLIYLVFMNILWFNLHIYLCC
jgi:hypothetical protein